MLYLLLTIMFLSPFLLGGLIHVRKTSQRQYDEDRKTYKLIFPRDVSSDRIEAVIRSIGSNLRDNKFKGDPSIAFEVHSSGDGINHFIRLPSRDSEYILDQLEGHLPGIEATPVKKPEVIEYVYGVELTLTDPARTLRISNPRDLSTKILKSLLTTGDGEAVTLQWIAFHTDRLKVIESNRPVRTSRPSLMSALINGNEASKEEVHDRVEKMSDQNYSVVCRVAATAEDDKRARELVSKVVRALKSENDPANRFKEYQIKRNLNDAMEVAATPFQRRVQMTVGELVAHLGWPIDNPQVQGLTTGPARRLPASDVIPREGGRLLGLSNIPGKERRIVAPHDRGRLHTYIGGRSGTGKSTMMSNNAYDDMKAGHGVIVIDASGSRSPETMYMRTLNLVPPERAEDVITLDVFAETDDPKGFNLFDQGSGRGVIDEIVGTFSALYPDVASGVTVRDLLYHGAWTLLDRGGLTLVDLATLISPRTPQDKAWASDVKKNVSDVALTEFWERMAVEDATGTYSKALHNKLWQISGRPELKHIIGQTKSSINMRGVLRDNKILLVSLSGLPGDSAELLASLLMSVLWSAVQTQTPEKANFLYLDEFQVSANVQSGLDDFLARARKHNLGVTLATQYLENIDKGLKAAIINNTGTRIIYSTSSTEAALWVPEFGGNKLLTPNDFTGIKMHEAIATIAVENGASPPVTMKASSPRTTTGQAARVVELSRRKHGTPIAEVQQQILARRVGQTTKKVDDKPVGGSPYKVENWDD